MRLDQQGISPTLSEVIRTHIDAVLIQMNVCLPAKIVKYYPETQYADVQVQLQRKYEDGTLAPIPVIPNVPVKHPRTQGGKTRIHLPVAVGDDCMLVFSQRSLDNWKTQGGMQDPADRRKFHLSDAFALLGGAAEPDAFAVNDPLSIEIVNDSGIVQIKPDGTINLGAYAPSKAVALGEAVEARLSAIESKVSALSIPHVHNIITPAPGSPTGPQVPPVTPFVPDFSVVSSSKVKVIP